MAEPDLTGLAPEPFSWLSNPAKLFPTCDPWILVITGLPLILLGAWMPVGTWRNGFDPTGAVIFGIVFVLGGLFILGVRRQLWGRQFKARTGRSPWTGKNYPIVPGRTDRA